MSWVDGRGGDGGWPDGVADENGYGVPLGSGMFGRCGVERVAAGEWNGLPMESARLAACK